MQRSGMWTCQSLKSQLSQMPTVMLKILRLILSHTHTLSNKIHTSQTCCPTDNTVKHTKTDHNRQDPNLV